MSEITNIGWTDSTWNPWTGCRRVSPGCRNCYMFAMLKRFGRDATERRKAKHWKKPLKWNFTAGDNDYFDSSHVRPRIFPSLCDWLDDEVPIEWLADFLKLIHDTPNLDWLLLSKRPELFPKRLQGCLDHFKGEASMTRFIEGWMMGNRVPENIWLGVSVEDQKRADERIPLLLQIPAKVRFLSVEPMLEKVDLDFWYDANEEEYGPYPGSHNPTNELHWVIGGLESGKDRRDAGVESIVDLARQCVAAGVPFFCKQDCAFKPGQKGRIDDATWALKQFPNTQ